MRIRFGTRGFLLLIAVILAASYFGYRYYYCNYKVLGIFFNEDRFATDHNQNVIEFQSIEISQATLTVIVDQGWSNEKHHDFILQANTQYVMDTHQGIFTLAELEKPVETRKTVSIFPDHMYVFGHWWTPKDGLRFVGENSVWQFGTVFFCKADDKKTQRTLSFRIQIEN